MTLSTLINRVSYAGDGSTTAFPFPYYFLLSSDLVVIEKDGTTGVETLMVLNTDYTVTGAGVSAGGTVTMTTAPASGVSLTVYRDPSRTQSANFVSEDPLPVSTINKALDLLTMQVQRVSDRLDRAVGLTEGFTESFSAKLPATLGALKVVRVNANANGLDTVDPSDATFAASLATLLGIGTNRQILTFDNTKPTSIKWGNAAWFNVKDYGAKGDGSTDDTAAIQACINAADLGNTIFFPHGTYKVTSTLTIANATRLIGDSMRSSELYWAGGASKMVNVTSNADNVEVESITLNNIGTATHGIYFSCVRAVFTRVFANPSVKFSTAIISSDTGSTTYHVVLRDCGLFSSQASQVNPIGFYAARGHTFIIDNCMFSGCTRGVVAGVNSNATVNGLSIVNSRFEQFSGISSGYPGSSTDKSIDIVAVNGLNISGCNFELDGDQDASATGQRCVNLQYVTGGSITGCSMSGNGVAHSLITIASSNATGVNIQGNYFSRFGAGGGTAGFAVEATGGGSVWQNSIGHNLVWDLSGPSASFDNTFTPTIAFGGAASGLTYAVNHGRAQRVGKFLTIRGYIELTSKGTSTGTFRVNGLPVVSDSNTQTGNYGNFRTAVSLFVSNMASLSGPLLAFISAGSTEIRAFELATGTQSELTNSNFTDTSTFEFSACYELLS